MNAWIRRLAMATLATAVIAVGLWARAEDAGKVRTLRFEGDKSWPVRPAEAGWGQTSGIAVDAKGLVWVFTRANPPVQVYDASGKYVRGWGQKEVKSAHYIRFDPQGNVWLADIGTHTVMQFTPEGKLLRTLGTTGKSGCDQTHLNKPTDMVVLSSGEVFVTDGYGNSRIVHFDKDGKFVKAWGKKGLAPGEFDLPHSIVADSKGRLYVADRTNQRVQVFEQDGTFVAQWKDTMIPWGLWITDKDEVWACGSSLMSREGKKGYAELPPVDQLVVKFDTSGRVLARAELPKGQQPGQVDWLHGMALDAKGNLYVCDIQGKRAQKFVPAR